MHTSLSTVAIEIHGVEQTFKTAKGLFPRCATST
jgi:nitrate/nitrite transport system ATP-binding protein